MAHLTSIRVAAAASLLAVVAGSAAPLLGFYLTVVAAAVLLGSAFAAHLEVVDDTRLRTVVEAVICAVAGILVLLDASIRFPTILGTSTPASARTLAVAAFVLTTAGLALAAVASRVWGQSVRRSLVRLARPLSRGLRRLVEATRHAAQGG
jgi:hypothetical protein